MTFTPEQEQQWEALADQRAQQLSQRGGKQYASALSWKEEGEEHHIILCDRDSVREAVLLIDTDAFDAPPQAAVAQAVQLRAKLKSIFPEKSAIIENPYSTVLQDKKGKDLPPTERGDDGGVHPSDPDHGGDIFVRKPLPKNPVGGGVPVLAA